MRSPQALLLIAILVFVFVAVYKTKAEEEPTEDAQLFFQKLQANDVPDALRYFGDNTCHCAPEGGYIAYLQYESGHNPNLAFLLGRNFTLGKMRYERLPYNGEKYLLPWDKPEDTIVYAPIEFSEKERMYFLPADMAYGYEMSDKQFQEFRTDPSKDWMNGFTLRLRPTLEPGFIPPRAPDAARTQFEKDAEQGLIPKEYLRYLHPKDPAAVKNASGEIKPASAYAAQMPTLKSVTVGLKVVRRGLFARWAVQKAGVQDPVVFSDGKEFKLKEPAPSP
jgi:hypothetical protein